MKKYLIILVMTIMPLLMSAAVIPGSQKQHNKNADQLMALVSQYSLKSGFEIVKVGSMGTSLIKPFIKMSLDRSDPEEKAILDMIKGIKKIAVVDYEDCASDVRRKFESKVENLLSDDDLLMNISDSGESLKIYGFVSRDGSKLTDFVLFSPSECALICLFGTIPMDALTTLASE